MYLLIEKASPCRRPQFWGPGSLSRVRDPSQWLRLVALQGFPSSRASGMPLVPKSIHFLGFCHFWGGGVYKFIRPPGGFVRGFVRPPRGGGPRCEFGRFWGRTQEGVQGTSHTPGDPDGVGGLHSEGGVSPPPPSRFVQFQIGIPSSVQF